MIAHYFSSIEWPQPFFEFFEFVTMYTALGAVGFRYSSLRGRLGSGQPTIYSRMAHRAAVIGLIGAVLRFSRMLMNVGSLAGRAKLTPMGFLTTPSPNAAYY